MYVFQDGERMEYRCSKCGQDRLYGFGRSGEENEVLGGSQLNCAICHEVTEHFYIGCRIPTASEAKAITDSINRYSLLMQGYER